MDRWLISKPEKFIQAKRDDRYDDNSCCDQKTSFENITNGLRVIYQARTCSRDKFDQNTLPKVSCDDIKERLVGAKIKVYQIVKYGNADCEVIAVKCHRIDGDNSFDGVFIRYDDEFVMVAIDGAHRIMDSTWFSYQNSDGSSCPIFGKWTEREDPCLDRILKWTTDSFMLGCFDMDY